MGIKLIIKDIQELKNNQNISEIEFIGFTSCLIFKYKDLTVLMKLSQFYPLFPPSNIRINNSIIFDNIHKYNTRNNEMIKKYYQINNLTQESILNHWKSNYTILNIFEEYELFIFIMNSSYVFHHFEKNNILNEDILKYISSFIK